jgi:hypothetical protein
MSCKEMVIVGSDKADTLVKLVINSNVEDTESKSSKSETEYSVKFKYNPNVSNEDWKCLRDYLVMMGRK